MHSNDARGYHGDLSQKGKGEALRLLRTNSVRENFEQSKQDLEQLRLTFYAVAIRPVTGQGFQNTK